jgi:uncharacterized membrane protein
VTRARADGLILFLLGAAIFTLIGAASGRMGIAWQLDFKGVYYGTRCLIQHCDPYQQAQIEHVYLSEGGENPSTPFERTRRQVVTRYVNSPTAFPFVAPFAVFPWGPAHLLWMTASGAGLLFSAFLIWKIGADFAPRLTGALLCVWLINSIGLLLLGNAAAIAISLCVVAVWCFIRDRFVVAGVICMAASLALKPHDAALVWLFFLLVGGAYRRRALQTLVVTILLSVPGILWITLIAPSWLQEMRANLAAISVTGGLNDPTPAALNVGTIGMIINFQTLTSVFSVNPLCYNSATYLICGTLILVWIIAAIRMPRSTSNAWLALAAISAFSMLPIYHRAHDAKLLLLALPACAILCAERGPMARLAVFITAAGFVLTGDLPLILLLNLSHKLADPSTGFPAKIVTILVGRTAPLILLIVGCFFLWICLRRARTQGAPAGPDQSSAAPAASTSA